MRKLIVALLAILIALLLFNWLRKPSQQEEPLSQRQTQQVQTKTNKPPASQPEVYHVKGQKKQVVLNIAEIDLARLKDLLETAKSEYRVENWKNAKETAERALEKSSCCKQDPIYGDVVHISHTIIGKIAFYTNDLAGAREHLLRAAQSPGSPQLNSAGPNMSIAKDLLSQGERLTVLHYLDEVGTFWKTPEAQKKLEQWKRDIAAGRIPDFGRNVCIGLTC